MITSLKNWSLIKFMRSFPLITSRPEDYKLNSTTKLKKDLESNVSIGPFARVRPGTVLKKGSKVGNFVEIKKSVVGNRSKVNHLSYIGDSHLGNDVNIGAGTITCNYDGIKKNKTKIKDKVFVGSNTSIIAPVTINKKSIIGAGSVITKNISKNSLALSRAPQLEIKNYRKKK